MRLIRLSCPGRPYHSPPPPLTPVAASLVPIMLALDRRVRQVILQGALDNAFSAAIGNTAD